MPSKEQIYQTLSLDPSMTSDPQEAARRQKVLQDSQQMAAGMMGGISTTAEALAQKGIQEFAPLTEQMSAMAGKGGQNVFRQLSKSDVMIPASKVTPYAGAAETAAANPVTAEQAADMAFKRQYGVPRMKGYADGGEIPAALSPNAPEIADQAMQGVPSVPAQEESNDSSQDGVQPGQPLSPFQQAINAQIQATQTVANAQSQQAKAQADLEGQAAQQAADAEKAYNTAHQQLSDERAHFIQDIQNSHIDPNQYLNSMGAGQKVATAVGLLLSGIGSGLSHQPNAAMQFLDQQINRDIAAQHAELGKKENLLSANSRQFGDLQQGTAMTRIMHNDYISHLISQAAAKSASPIAQAQAQMAIGQLGQQSAMLQHQIALAGATGAGQAANPAALVPLMVPEKQQEGAFKEIGNAQNAKQLHGDVLKQFDQAAQENTVMRTGAGLLRTPASVINMRNLMMPILKDNEGRINETEIKMMEDFVPQPGDTDAKIQQKRLGLSQFIRAKMATPVSSGYGVPGVQPSKINFKAQ